MAIAYAPGKVILFGEHAVVYGRPAIAAPVAQVRAQATVQDAPPGSGLTLVAADLGETHVLGAPPSDAMRALEVTARNTLARLGLASPPDLRITIRSDIPIGRGMGSGAAVATALVRALAMHLGAPLPPDEVSRIVYETEIIHHGTPSGVDNTVIAHEQPVYFVRGQGMERFRVGRAFRLAIADTGIYSPTRVAVGDVRAAWQADPARYDALFDAIGTVVVAARRAIEAGDVVALGPLMQRNQALLREMGVSAPELERLIAAAQDAGAPGAKLVGAGRGGNMIALLEPGGEAEVIAALQAAGAARVLVTTVA